MGVRTLEKKNKIVSFGISQVSDYLSELCVLEYPPFFVIRPSFMLQWQITKHYSYQK